MLYRIDQALTRQCPESMLNTLYTGAGVPEIVSGINGKGMQKYKNPE